MNAGGALLTVPQLLACGGVLLLIMGVSSWLLLRADKQNQQLAGRLAAVSSSYARTTSLQTEARQRPAKAGTNKVWLLLAGLFGYDLSRASQYPAKIPVVLVIVLVAAFAASQLLGTLFGTVTRLAIPVFWLGASRFAFKSFERKRAGRLYVQFPDALALIVRSVRVGIPVSESVRNVAKECLEPTCTEFTILSDQLAIGVPLEAALRECAARNGLPEYRFFATALSLQAQTGGGLTETLENLSEVIRKRVAVKNRAYALASEARTTTLILAALPVVTALGLALLDPKYIGVLLFDPAGNAVLGGAVTMLLTGVGVMRTIISRSLR